MRLPALLSALTLVFAACSVDTGGAVSGTDLPPASTTPSVLADGSVLPSAPSVPTGALAPATVADIDSVFSTLQSGVDIEALDRLGASGDARVAWLLADLLRFFPRGQVTNTSVSSFESLTGATVGSRSVWNRVTDLLIGWDTPQPPGYRDWKRQLFTLIEPGWDPFFADAEGTVDWRHISWGGVLIDDRSVGDVDLPCPDGCIPALDDPAVTDVAGGDWYPDERIIFGLVVNGESRAYPKNIMEVHEMVNDTLGGVRIGIPYCTLCGSAQGYITDAVPDGFSTIELRTSGLLSRSNKVMFDLNTFSMFDTFLGTALTGPLRRAGFTLEAVTVVTSTWGDWKVAHPESTILAEDGGIGRSYDLDPLGRRDDNGPVFPIGDVDPRLPVQEQVVGVQLADGTPVAFPVEAARRTLERGGAVELAGVTLGLDGSGLVATLADGGSLTSHQAFWFAWSQFQPDTLLWVEPLG